MGKPTGFIQWERVMPSRRDKRQRLGDYSEIYAEQNLDESQRQGGRCMDCGVPFCHQGCPLGNHIPDWADLVYRDQWQAAYRRLAATNNFPEFTGRLCPAPCEGACVLGISQPPVAIEQLEKDIIEHAFKNGWVSPEPALPPTGKRVAIVGSGPAGLAAAEQLVRAGHGVRVYERNKEPGGLLRYGIPDFKLEKSVVMRRIQLLRDQGIEFIGGVSVGDDVPWETLTDENDAVLITIGAQRPHALNIPGSDLDGVVEAMPYLSQQNRINAGEPLTAPRIDARGKHVVVLGGGDTGSDCIGTALRQGAASVTNFELMPASPEERGPGNPWPQWPMVFRTSTSHEEGGDREFAVQATHLSGKDGHICELHAVRITLENIDGRQTIVPVAGSERQLPCDLLIVAIGFSGAQSESATEQLGIEADSRGNLRVDTDYSTTRPGVFSAGDAMRGASLIVWAISDGREAARGVDRFLRQSRSPRLPTRGSDSDFGGPSRRVKRLAVSDNKPAGSEPR